MILVTGGTGFVGRHLVSALLEQGGNVGVFTRKPALVEPTRGLSIFTGDLEEEASFAPALRDAVAVVHLAARVATPGTDPQPLYDFNVRSAEVVARAVRRAGVKRFVHVSSGGVYGDGRSPAPHLETEAPSPGNAYERSKLAGEAAVHRVLEGSDVECVVLRPAGIFGPGRAATLAFFDDVRRRAMWIHGSPNVIVHPTHVSDVVQACVKVLNLERSTERVINVAGGRALRFQEFVALTGRALGVAVRQLTIPSPIGRPVAAATTAALQLARLRAPNSIERASRAYVNRSLDISLARRTLGYEPMELEAALGRTIDALGR